MANNPVQVVLNTQDFMTAPEKGRSGPTSDPFKGNDDDFVLHKRKLKAQLTSISTTLASSEFGEVGYARVTLQEAALAKSNRPVRRMFAPKSAIAVGAGNLGELFYRVSRKDVDRLAADVDESEDHAKWTENSDGKSVPVASAARADVGAIADIGLPDPEDKRTFDVREAVEWLEDPDTDGRYQIELFERIPPTVVRDDPRRRLFSSFATLLKDVARSTVAVEANRREPRLLNLKVMRPVEGARLASAGGREIEIKDGKLPVDPDVRHHHDVLAKLASHPLVRRISLPVRLHLAERLIEPAAEAEIAYTPTPRVAGARYPKVGVIDSGIDDFLSPWIEERSGFLDPADLNRDHGTQVASLLVEARNLNGAGIGRENDGCLLYDIPLYIKGLFGRSFNSFDDFLNQIDVEVGDMVESHGVRVFNMSITAQAAVEGDQYGRLAQRLDEIQARHGVIFVIAAGNLESSNRRSPWPAKPGAVVNYFASRPHPDAIFQPAESVFSVCVGAVNPDAGAHVYGAPTTYTCRGPGLRVGCKPDVAHFGGALPTTVTGETGLSSLTLGGVPTFCAGTSMAAPLVAKTIAMIDARLEDEFPTHTLHALLVHHSDLPDCLVSPRLRDLARQFCGFGVPIGTDEMLTTEDDAITLVFNSALPRNSGRAQVMRFGFTWPAELVDAGGKCTGRAKMTLVARPPLDAAYGAEFVRVNLDAKLQQRQAVITRKDGRPSYKNEIEYITFRRAAGQQGFEKELIKQGLKWWPVKKYELDLGDGIGSSSEWRVEVDSVTRSGEAFPEQVPFSLVLTISDPARRPIFQSMRRSLGIKNVELRDIRVSSRSRQRT